jgi:4-hydroxythreonine-4-phosphate dehydrogenase
MSENGSCIRPLIALTMGDVAGIGPEVIARAWSDPRLHAVARPFVIGEPAVLERAFKLVENGSPRRIRTVRAPEDSDSSETTVPCLAISGVPGDLHAVEPATIDPRSGRAAFEFVIAAVGLALEGRIDAITTLPLNKHALVLGGIRQPGHTEILAERCGVADHAMMLYLETDLSPSFHENARASRRGTGLGVIHVTLHVPLRNVFGLLTRDSILSKIQLADGAMRGLTGGAAPRIAVASLNPHAGEDGLFGDEEQTTIRPAVELAARQGLDVCGPLPNDTLFSQALDGAFDAVVAMYHDQGHIALKTVGFARAVNVTLGLPIVRSSVAHGTAFDIAWKGVADPSSLIEAVRIAARLVAAKRALRTNSTGPVRVT